LGAGVAVALGAPGFAAYQLNRTDRTTTARTVDEAIDEFRGAAPEPTGVDTATDPTVTDPSIGDSAVADSSSPDPSGAGEAIRLPAPGVYVYRTTGSDRVDALGGAEHAYPAETTITVRETDCGVTKRWDVAVERWEELTVCVSAAGVERTDFVAYHQFFGTGVTETERCEGAPRPAPTPGAAWRFTCDMVDESTPWQGTVLEPEPVDVGGATVLADHVVLVTVDDPEGDDMRIETWFQAGTDLVLREIGERRTTEDSMVGEVHYEERYEIVLTDLDPLR
jgi:hypothetical protein